MSNNQRSTVGLSAGDYTRLKRIRGAKQYVSANLTTNKDIGPNPVAQLEYTPSSLIKRVVGTSRIRRPASMWTDFKASQTADVVSSASNGVNGNILTTTKVCDCTIRNSVLQRIQVGTNITSCWSETGINVYSFTPPSTGAYTITALSVGSSDPDLYITYPGGHIGGPNGSILYFSDSAGTSVVSQIFEGGKTYEVGVFQYSGACFELTVQQGA